MAAMRKVETTSSKTRSKTKKKTNNDDKDTSLSSQSSSKKTRKTKKETNSSTLPIDRPPRTSFPFYGLEKSHKLDKEENNSTSTDTFISRKDTPEGRYYLYETNNNNNNNKELFKFPSVTTILDQTKPRSSVFSLRNWSLSMIETHGEEGFKKWKRNVIKVGQDFHAYLEMKLKEKNKPTVHDDDSPSNSSLSPPSPPLSPSLPLPPKSLHTYSYNMKANFLNSLHSGYSSLSSSLSSSLLPVSFDAKQLDNYRYMASIEDVLKDISVVMVTEGMVMHKELGYCGTFDCVAKYKDSICLIDWKTSTKPKPTIDSLYDYPLQTTAYAGAINSNNDRYPFKVDSILIVVAYSTGHPAHVHLLDTNQCLLYWEKWLDRLDQYHIQFAHDLSTVY